MYAAIRVRGDTHLNPDNKKTLELLKLYKVNTLVLLPKNEKIEGMLKKVENYITWGEINEDILEKLIKKKLKLDEEFFKKNNIKTYKELAEKIIKDYKTLKILKLKHLFFMHPPRKGYGRRGIKKPFNVGGALGYRKEDIAELINRML